MSPAFRTTTVGCSSSLSTSLPSSSSPSPLSGWFLRRSLLSSVYHSDLCTKHLAKLMTVPGCRLTNSGWFLITHFCFELFEESGFIWFGEGYISAWNGHDDESCWGCGHRSNVQILVRVFRELEKAVLFKLLSMVFERRGLRHYQK